MSNTSPYETCCSILDNKSNPLEEIQFMNNLSLQPTGTLDKEHSKKENSPIAPNTDTSSDTGELKLIYIIISIIGCRYNSGLGSSTVLVLGTCT